MCLLQGKGRTLYLHRRGHIKPEEKFNFPLLSSWDYGWRLGTMESQSAPCGVVTVKWCINFRKINLLNQKSPLGTKCTITSVVILCFNTRRSCNSELWPWLIWTSTTETVYMYDENKEKHMVLPDNPFCTFFASLPYQLLLIQNHIFQIFVIRSISSSCSNRNCWVFIN